MAENGPHWPTVDFAVLAIGGVHVPIYPTLLPEQAAYIVQDSGAKVVIAQGRDRLDGLLERRGEMPSVEHIVAVGCEPPAGVHGFVDLIERGRGWGTEALAAECKLAKPDDLATLIYTSGTTGNPKGVMLSHGNIASNLVHALERLDIEGSYTALSFLPLAHSFERTVDYIYFYRGCTIAYAESVQAVAQNLGEVKPHVFVSVPRVYEKVLARVQDNVAKSSPTKQKIFAWAVAVGKQALPWRLRKSTPPGLLGIKTRLADKLVFAKIRERLGGRCPVARPSDATWRSSSGARACRSTRATASPRPRRCSPSMRTTPSRWAPSARRFRASSCASPKTAKSSAGAPTSCRAISTTRPRPQKSSTRRVGSTPATSASWTRRASSPSRTARRS
jgi:long-chain acyl-CoA synthetase